MASFILRLVWMRLLSRRSVALARCHVNHGIQHVRCRALTQPRGKTKRIDIFEQVSSHPATASRVVEEPTQSGPVVVVGAGCNRLAFAAVTGPVLVP